MAPGKTHGRGGNLKQQDKGDDEEIFVDLR
jgi:hypothetical protein